MSVSIQCSCFRKGHVYQTGCGLYYIIRDLSKTQLLPLGLQIDNSALLLGLFEAKSGNNAGEKLVSSEAAGGKTLSRAFHQIFDDLLVCSSMSVSW
jgi:hypothetical protein